MLSIQTQTHKQNVSVKVAPEPTGSAEEWRGSTAAGSAAASTAAESAIEWRASAVDSVGAGSAHLWRGRIGWITVRNCLSSMKEKVVDDMADKHNECWWSQWRRLTHGHNSEYEIVQGLWSNWLAKGVINPVRIQWVDWKWKWGTLQKLYSSICSISGRAEAEGEEGSYKDHLSYFKELQE
jgi:hypothetical protein